MVHSMFSVYPYSGIGLLHWFNLYFRQKLKMTDLAPEIREQVREVMKKDCVSS